MSRLKSSLLVRLSGSTANTTPLQLANNADDVVRQIAAKRILVCCIITMSPYV